VPGNGYKVSTSCRSNSKQSVILFLSIQIQQVFHQKLSETKNSTYSAGKIEYNHNLHVEQGPNKDGAARPDVYQQAKLARWTPLLLLVLKAI
jgi:hypothetical protein